MNWKRGIGFLLMLSGMALMFSNSRITGAAIGAAQTSGVLAIILFVIGLIVVAKSHQNQRFSSDDSKLRDIIGDDFDRKMRER